MKCRSVFFLAPILLAPTIVTADQLTDQEVLVHCELRANLGYSVMLMRQMERSPIQIQDSYTFKPESNWRHILDGFVELAFEKPISDSIEGQELTASAFEAKEYADCLVELKQLQEYLESK